MRRLAVLVATCLLALVGGAALAESTGTAVTDTTALRALIAGNTLYGANTRDGAVAFKWSEFHCPNGRSIYVRGSDVYRGKWWLEGSEVCYTYNELEPGAQFCFRFLAKDGGGYDLHGRGDPPEHVNEVTVLGRVPGDPFKIQNLVGGTCEELSS